MDQTDRLLDALYGPSAARERQVLVHRYEVLPERERVLVQALSLGFSAINRTTLSNWLLSAFPADPLRKDWFYTRALLPPLQELEQAGLVLRPVGDSAWGCHPLMLELATRDALAEGLLPPIKQVLEEPYAYHRRWGFRPPREDRDLLFRDLRLALYTGDQREVVQLLEEWAETSGSPAEAAMFLGLVAGNPLDRAWMSGQPRSLQRVMCAELLRAEQGLLRRPGMVRQHLFCLNPGEEEGGGVLPAGVMSALGILRRGRLLSGVTDEEPLRDGGHERDSEAACLEGMRLAQRGEDALAIAHFKAALTLRRRETGTRKAVLPGLMGLVHVICLIRRGQAADLRLATKLAGDGEDLSRGDLWEVYCELGEVLQSITTGVQQPRPAPDPEGARDTWSREHTDGDELLPTLGVLLLALARYWRGAEYARELEVPLRGVASQAEEGGYKWVEAEARELLGRLGDEEQATRARALHQRLGTASLCDAVRANMPWERTLDALELLAEPARQNGKPRAQRLAWLVTYLPERQSCRLEPRIQKCTARGGWTKGRKVTFKHLSRRSTTLDFLLPQDHKVLAHISQEQNPWSRRQPTGRYVLDHEAALTLLEGHPNLFWANNPQLRVELALVRPELRVTAQGDDLCLTVEPFPPHAHQRLNELRLEQESSDDLQAREYNRLSHKIWRLEEALERHDGQDRVVVARRDEGSRLRVIVFDEEQLRASRLLGEEGLRVPAAGKQQVERIVGSLSLLMEVQSDVGGEQVEAREVSAEGRLHLLCSPLGDGIQVHPVVRPLGGGGAHVQPGQGGVVVVSAVKGERLQARRDLADEAARVERVMDACPALAEAPRGEDGTWLLHGASEALQALLELGALDQEEVCLSWPQGEALRVHPRVSLSNFSLSLQHKKGWFEADGKLQVAEDLVLDMRQLLEIVSRSQGSFVPLGQGEFLALTRELRQRLDELAAFTEVRAKELRLSTMTTPFLDELVDEVGEFNADRAFTRLRGRLHEAQALQPILPSTLQATLRGYQEEGFGWLARLASWGAGACLADDMGLGKTVQALALLLDRAGDGPSLVVAPLSVCTNWEREAHRFAPTLQVQIFGGKDRTSDIAALGPGDLLICSYGLLVQEQERLCGVSWSAAVLDEAQAIKNPATKRARAAMKLQAGVRVATTGTPIENRLMELWTLFRFLNPGLLGSKESFRQRFALPIERDSDVSARHHLKQLLRPFILRRTKDQVLDELPERTDILFTVTMSPDEAAHYEALRRGAVERLEGLPQGPAGQRSVQVLAELTRLRRACCHPRLVTPESLLPGAKLQALDSLLTDLRAGGHRALVFSQFVGNLTIVREHLDGRGFTYQYLDGSTSAIQRQRRVDAFQGGKGELFLISLRAGGLGLNLTAADFVIHLDPWWNPAVEDQASDRAHRIGQRRPVTCYRLILSGTIEEKIVAMHKDKRRLARDILDGADKAHVLSADDLMELLRYGAEQP